MSLGITEIVLILVVFLVLFGGKRIPELARGLGKAQAEYKKAKETIENEVNEFKNEVAKVTAAETQKTSKKTVAVKSQKNKAVGKTATAKQSSSINRTTKSNKITANTKKFARRKSNGV